MRDLTEAIALAEGVIEGVLPDQWQLPTPCPDWPVRLVVNHLVSGQLIFAGAIAGEPLETLLPLRDQDHLGDDPGAAYRSSAESLLAAVAAPGALERPVRVPVGTVPGVVALHLRVVECLVHGWDVARATGQRFDVPDDLAERELAFTAANLSRVPADRQPFGPPQPAADDAPPLDRLAAQLGRSVSWSPAGSS
jgi:uncharacterized protein (TIGR03086 family)